MKLIKYIIAFVAIATMVMSCSTDVDEPQISPSGDFVAPVINESGDIIINADNAKAENVVFTWKSAEFGLPVQILYSVYLTSGEESALLGTSFSNSFSISKADFNGVVINSLGVPANSTGEVKAYVTAKLNGSDAYEAINSNTTNTFNVTTYAASLSYLYLCGEFNDWKIENAPIFWETAGGSNIFTCMVDLTRKNETPTDPNRSYFKVTAEQSWSGDNWGYDALIPSWENPEQNDKNFSLDITENNIFEITVNKAAMTIDQKAKGKVLGLVGDFNSWGENDAVFTYNSLESAWLTQPVELAAGSGIKVRADAPSWNTNWGATGVINNDIPGGFELGAGAGNITVPDAGTYIVKLHANRTPYILELIKQ